MKDNETWSVSTVAGEYMSPAQVAELLPGLSENALAIRRHRHMEPTFCRFGRTVVYPVAELRTWIAACRIQASVRQRGR